MLKLNRKQELALINLGFQKLLDSLVPHKIKTVKKSSRIPWNKGKKTRKWTKAQREKYAETMRQKWGDRKNK
jgi:hypothetical protein